MASSATHEPPRDAVDAIVEGWRAAQPDLDVTPTAIAVRITRLRAVFERVADDVFGRHGLSAPAFSALAAVVRMSGEDGVSQVDLMRALRLTSGTVSVRIDRLAADGLVERRPDAADRRGARITPTGAGRAVFARAVPDHLAAQRRLLAGLSPGQQETLAGLLRTLLVDLEGCPAGDDPGRLIGAEIVPAHEAAAMRAAVGLSDRPGPLLRAVEPGGPADRAGLAAGDVLLAVDGEPVRSITALARAVSSPGAHRVRRLRGETEGDAVVDLGGA